MNVAVIGCDASEIILTCHITISGLAKEGHKVYAIIAPPDQSESQPPISSPPPLAPEITKISDLASIGIIETFVIERFDYSAVTQANANAVNSFINNFRPSLVIMPSWKSLNHNRKILARTSLIACRGIGTILMYEVDTSNRNFNPSIIFEAFMEGSLPLKSQASIVEKSSVVATNQDLTTAEPQTFESKPLLQSTFPKDTTYQRIEEKFESHRTLLVEESGLF